MMGRLRLVLLICAVILRLYSQETAIQRVYVVATSFYNIRDSITWAELQARWAGENDAPLAMDQSAFPYLRETLGTNGEITILTEIENAAEWADAHRDGWVIVPFDKLSPRLKVLQIDAADIFYSIEGYPLAFPTDESNYNPDKLTVIAMSGVTALTRGTGEMLDKHGAEWAVNGILPAFANADFRHTSNEVSFAENCLRPGTEKIFGSLCSKGSYFDVLEQIGFNIIELTGNHNNDYGYDAYKQTLERYADQDILTFGGGLTEADAQAPLLVSHNGNEIAFIGCNWAGPKYAWATATTPGAAYCDENWLEAALRNSQADIKIMTVQYPEYDRPAPVALHRDRFMKLAEFGADIVLGTSSHRPQTVGFNGNRFIHYGLGNLFFDQTAIQQKRFFIDRFAVYDGRLINVTLLTGQIEDLARPRLMTAQEREQFLSTLLYLSQTANKSD